MMAIMLYRRDVGLKHIAELAGVSSTTVSRVLRGKGEISADTRTRVETIARDLGYRPNLAVRTMQTGKSGIVGILMRIGDDPGFRGHLLDGIHDTLIEADYLPVLIWAKQGNPKFSESKQVHRLIDHRIDGLILSVENISSDFFQYVDGLDIPVVIIDEIIEGVNRDTVVTDNKAGSHQAAEHLLSLGHTDLACFGDRPLDGPLDAGRGHAFLDAVSAVSGARCRFAMAGRKMDRYKEAVDLLGGVGRPTAVFAFNDYLALHVARAAADLGIHIPAQLSIVGFGNIPHIVDLLPELTTFEQLPMKIGETASNLLLGRMEGGLGLSPRIVKITPRMIVRGSTASPSE
jgi:LacI family transcriptional regulator